MKFRPPLLLLCFFLTLGLGACGSTDDNVTDATDATDTTSDSVDATADATNATDATSDSVDATADATNATDTTDPDVGPVACSTNAECTATNEVCMGPSEPNVCGIAPREGCSSDLECGTDRFCHAIPDGCSQDGVGSECGDACVDDQSCGQDMHCGSDGSCEALLCDAGFTCPAHMACDPTSFAATDPVHAQHHGCVIVVCSDDQDCGANLSCVNGYCQTGLGVCGEPMAVP